MIIFSFGRRMNKNKGQRGPFECKNCHNMAYFALIEQRVWFTLFFIPVIPYQTNRFLICNICSRGFALTKEEFDKALLAEPQQLGTIAPPLSAGQTALPQTSRQVTCPTPNCGQMIIVPAGSAGLVTCPKCQATFTP